MAEENNPCQVNPSADPRSDRISAGSKFITSVAPTLTYESVTVENNNPQSREDETTFITINLSLKEAIKGEDAVSWYDDANYTQYLRVRVITCLAAPNSKELDFISQRVNEYSEGEQTKPPEDFISSLINVSNESAANTPTMNFGTQVEALLGDSGPFDVQKLTQDMKEGNQKIHYFNPVDLMSDLVVYDSPIAEMMILDLDGTPETNPNYGKVARRRTTEILPSTQSEEGQEAPIYQMEKAYLHPITLSVGADGETIEQRILSINNQLSLYAFVYFDYNQLFV